MGGQNLSAVIARRRAGMGNLRAGVPRERRSLIYLLDIFRPATWPARVEVQSASLIALGGQPQLSRRMSWTGRTTSRGAAWPAVISDSSSAKAVAPSS